MCAQSTAHKGAALYMWLDATAMRGIIHLDHQGGETSP